MATIAAAAIGAAGAIGGGIASAQGAKRAAAAGRGRNTTIPLPPYAEALNHYTARLLAANATDVAPSFGDWLKSGGQATFPLHDIGLNPEELMHLGFVDPVTGGSRPMYDPATGKQIPGRKLTPEQLLYLGQHRVRDARAEGGQASGPIAQYARVTGRLGRLNEGDQTPRQQSTETRLSDRLAMLERRLGLR